MKRFMSLVAGSIVVFAAQAASAAPPVYFKNPIGFAGTGCPASTVVPIGAGTDTLSILFSSYDAGNGKPSVTGLPSAACSFAVPIHVPRGFQASLLKVDWMGRVQGKGTLKRKYFIAGQPNQPWLINNYSADFMANDTLGHASFATGCKGGDFILRLNSNITAQQKSYMAVDTADLQNKIIFLIQWKPC